MKKNFKVVVADSDIVAAKSLSNFFEKKVNVIVEEETDNGVELLGTVEIKRPDVVIMDLPLVDLDGIGVIKHIRKDADCYGCPLIIVHTSLFTQRVVEAAIAAGADYVILKPQDFEDIYNTITDILAIDDGETELPSTSNEEFDLEVIVTNYIQSIGIPANVKGYRYLRSAVIRAIEDTSCIDMITKVLYPSVAKEYGSTPSRVERAIRHSIDKAWDRRHHPSGINSIFGRTLHEKPSNSEFIATLSEKIRLELKKQSA